MITVAFFGFKNAPQKNSIPLKANTAFERLRYKWQLEPAKDYITPLKNATFVSNTFTAGYFLPGTVIAQSMSSEYLLQYQTDGNLVLYNLFPYVRAIWASNTIVSNPQNAVFSSNGVATLWTTSNYNYWYGDGFSCTYTNSYFWSLQDDGNFVCYDTTCSLSQSTRTAGGVSSPNWGSFNSVNT